MIYIVDDADRLIHLDNEWLDFAAANGGAGLAPERVIGRQLWSFIQGFETRQFYKLLLARVRRGESLQFIMRCDSPVMRRWLRVRMLPFAIGCVVFDTEVIRTEEREEIPLLISPRVGSGQVIVSCDICGRLKMADDNWVEPEEAMALLTLFEREELPQLAHAICEECYVKMIGGGPPRHSDPFFRPPEILHCL